MEKNDLWIEYIEKLTQFLNTNNLLEGLYHGNFYYDEPPYYYYSATIKNNKNYVKRNTLIDISTIYSGGISFFSKELAMLKCLSEAVERIAQESFSKDAIIYDTYQNIKNSALNLSLNIKNKKIETELLGWVKGKDLLNNKDCLIPAQYIHYSYYRYRKETLLTQLISTGGATGWSHDQALLTGLYEVIERDAFMTAYFIKAPVVHIDLNSIEDSQVNEIRRLLKRYNLEWHLFDITNDLNVPAMTSIIIDKTGYGPAVTVGASCSFDKKENIIKSLSEALMIRPWVRAYFNNPESNILKNQTKTKLIESRVERAFHWYPLDAIKNLSFWLKAETKNFLLKEKTFRSTTEELESVMKIISGKNLNYYYADISHKQMHKAGFSVYKVIIPELHGLSLHESNLFHNYERLEAVAKHFNMKKYSLNTIPHPFL